MSKQSRTLAFLAYLLSIPGWLYVLLFQRKDKLALYHAKQALVLTLVVVGSIVVWFLASWVLSWVPLAGPLLAAALFSQIILIGIFVVGLWILGMVYALQTRVRPLPLVGKWRRKTTPSSSCGCAVGPANTRLGTPSPMRRPNTAVRSAR